MPRDDRVEQAPRGQRPQRARAAAGGRQPEQQERGQTPEPAPAEEARAQRPAERPRLKVRYAEEVAPALQREFQYANAMMVPRVLKVVVNIGLGEALTNPRALESATRDLGLITGQRPVATKAHQSVARFKVREGQTIGVMVTLRGARMYQFLDKLFNTALPRIRDFRGVSRSAVDGRGNYSLGLREQVVFPEIDYNQVDKLRGLQVNIITSARSDREALRLLELLGMPLARAQDGQRAATG